MVLTPFRLIAFLKVSPAADWRKASARKEEKREEILQRRTIFAQFGAHLASRAPVRSLEGDTNVAKDKRQRKLFT